MLPYNVVSAFFNIARASLVASTVPLPTINNLSEETQLLDVPDTSLL
jgi:hypothetical protein